MDDPKNGFDVNDLIFEVAPANGTLRRPVRVLSKSGAEIWRDETNPNRAGDRERFAADLAQQTGADPAQLRRRVHAELPPLADKADAQAEALAAQAEPAWTPGSQAKAAAEKLLADPGLLDHVAAAAERLGVVHEDALVALAYLAVVSRLLPKPLYLQVRGDPAAGKSFITRTVCLELVPPGVVLDVTDLTPQALYYMRETGLRRRVLLLGERRRQLAEESVDRTKALRELVENGRVSILLPNPKARTAERIEVEGPAAVIETCSHDAVAAEDVSRAVLAWPDESPEQTKRIIEDFARRKAQGVPGLPESEREAIWAIQHILEPAEVVLPDLLKLAECFPSTKLEARRAFVRVVAVAEACALVHQRQRQRDPQGRVVATRGDLRVALTLLRPWLGATLGGGVPPRVQRIWDAVRNREGEFTAADLEPHVGLSSSSIRRALAELCQAGAVEVVEGWQPGQQKNYRVANPGWEPNQFVLDA